MGAKNSKGFTLVELQMGMLCMLFLMLAAGVVLVGSAKGFKKLYSKAFSDIRSNVCEVQRRFDNVVRRSSGNPVLSGESIQVNYYGSTSASVPDRWAKFYKSGSTLMLDEGIIGGKETSSAVLCENVSSCTFMYYPGSKSAQMTLELDDGSQQYTTVSSAYIHN